MLSEKRAAIIRALKANPSASAVARQIGGVSITTVWKIAKDEKIDLSQRHVAKSGRRKRQTPKPALPEPISQKTRDQIVAALKDKPRLKTGVIAMQAGVRRVTVWQIAGDEKIDLRATAGTQVKAATVVQTRKRAPFTPIPQEKREQIIAALKVNPNSAQVARTIGGVSQSTVGDIARKTGIELTAGKELQRRIFGPKLEAERERASTTGMELTIAQPAEREITVEELASAAVSALAKKSIADAFTESGDLMAAVGRNMPNREFRGELRSLVRKFDKRPGGVD